jgi:hypothetical protein
MLDRAGWSNREVAARAAVAPETVSRWRGGVQAISDTELGVVLAMLRERGLSVTPGWVRYGSNQTISVPDPAKDRKLTMQEIGRARRAAELEERAVAPPKPAKKKRGGGAA